MPVILKDIEQTIRVGFGGKALGNTFGRPSADKDLAKFLAEFPGKTAYVMPAVGGNNIVDVDSMAPEELDKIEADALFTKSPQALLVLNAADCMPLVFYVPGQKILALAHVGRQGASLHLPKKLVEQLGSEPSLLHCYIGPSIQQKSYRFPKENFDKKLDESWGKYITDEPDGIHIDLPRYVLDELKHAGIKPENIKIENVDTAADLNYFSHRRHKLTGKPDGRNCFAACLI